MPGKKKKDTVNTPGSGIWENNFDPRIQAIPSYLPSATAGQSYELKRGYMTTAFPKGQSGKFYMLNFLYNPSTVNVSHSIDAANQVMPAYTRSDQDQGTPLTAAGGTLGFSLLFDRSYEMSDSSQFDTVEGTFGVMADIHVLYNLVGINSKQQVWSSAESPSSTASTTGGDVLGIMQMNPVWVRFGQARHSFSKQLPAISRMEYFGYLNNLDISYTHFSQRMTPVRCAVSVSMQLMSTAGWV
ncbi:hypothetical protein [Streptomyces sp. NPDC017260]|uniref:hypothetical protein n=1 Tax=unclassified Streptomyces TaxID=2593676 RepID=UPI00378B115D